MTGPWTASERRELVDAWSALTIRRLEGEALDEGERAALDASSRDYVDGLPAVPLLADPMSGEVVAPAMDVVDLDGMWWDESGVYRPASMTLPDTFVTMTGAVSLGEPLARAPFQAQPGPAVPYVIPALMADSAVLAVLVEVPIGPHVGVATVYLADPIARERPRANIWGAPYYRHRDPDGTWTHGSVDPWVPDFDFDLRPWVENRRLWWVPRGESGGDPRSGLDGCPFLDRPGPRTWCYIRWGRARYDPEPTDFDRTISSYRS